MRLTRSGGSSISRRTVLRGGIAAFGFYCAGFGPGCGGKGPDRRVSNLANVGPLGPADANGVRLPAGFSSRVVAMSGAAPTGTAGYLWHEAPAAGAAFAVTDGGWIYVSNSELAAGAAGASALRFAIDGRPTSAYSILSGTTRNHGGGPTPWGTWLSCERIPRGMVWECDPTGVAIALARPALGVFEHGGAAVDPLRDHIYMTESAVDGRLYRYVPNDDVAGEPPDLDDGRLEVARVVRDDGEGPVEWLSVPDPTYSAGTPTRAQVSDSTVFLGGAGIWYGTGVVYFATHADNRVWAYDVEAETIEIVYDDDTAQTPILTGPGDLTVSGQGDVVVAEDGGDMQIIALVPSGEIVPIAQLVGHDESEITGVAFDPSGTFLYFSSQRGAGDPPSGGITYEVTGPFFL